MTINPRAHRTAVFGLFALLGIWPASLPQAGLFGPSTFWQCILDEMPEAKNDQAARAAHAHCEAEFPAKDNYEPDSWQLTGPSTAQACTEKYAKETPSLYGRILIRKACYLIYPKDNS